MAPEEGEDVVYIIYQEEGTRIARAECEDGAMIHIFATLQMIENEWLCVICMCVTLGVYWMCYCIW